MITTYLKFQDEAEAIEHLAAFRQTNGSNVWQTPYGRISYESDKDSAYVAANNGCKEADVVLLHADGEWLTYKDGANLDIVGTIYKPTGKMIQSDEGFEYPEMAPLDGFHVNILSDGFDEALEPFRTTPSTPARVFA